jgi:alpha-soluble NSF attachment protein
LKSKDEWQSVKEKVDKYGEMDVHYVDSYEQKLINGILEAFEKKGDVQIFTNSLREYDKIKKLDNWNTTLLTKVKEVIEKAESLE